MNSNHRVQGRPLAIIIEDDCIGCGRCVSACHFDALVMNDDNKAEVIVDKCRGCMRCAPPCPTDAIKRTIIT